MFKAVQCAAENQERPFLADQLNRRGQWATERRRLERFNIWLGLNGLMTIQFLTSPKPPLCTIQRKITVASCNETLLNSFIQKRKISEANMTRVAAFIVAATLIAAPAFAGTYSAKPVAAPTAGKIIGKDISWTCAGGSCRGSTEASRPLVLCQDLAKHAGRIESFTADGQALSAEQLAKCNTAAKGGDAPALAKVN
jgi:hypothetical protein